MGRTVLSLQNKRALCEQLAGGKGASLARLNQQGFQIPDGFVITAEAFRRFLSSLGISNLSRRRLWSESDLERVRELLVAVSIPTRLKSSILHAYDNLGGAVAVRSSMVGEDTQHLSFAGQLDTFLNVEGHQALLAAIKNCWASVFNWHLYDYLVHHESRSSQDLLAAFAMAVVVQRMVQVQAGGVAFSADPMTGQPYMIVEAAQGSGDAVVRGIVTPDRYIVDEHGNLSESHPATEGAPVMQPREIHQLAELVRSVTDLRDHPQDIEWAWDGREIYLLQSRPITSLANQPVYSRGMIAEMLPGLIKPLVWSVSNTSKLKNVLGRIFDEVAGPLNVDYTQLAVLIHSRAYANNTMLSQILENMGLPSNFFEVMSRGQHARRTRRARLNPKMLGSILRMLSFARRHLMMTDRIHEFIERHDRELDTYRDMDWSLHNPKDLLQHASDMTDLYSETMWYNFIGPMNMMIRNHILNRFVQKHLPDIEVGDLVRGLVGLKSLESNSHLQRLADQAKALPGEIPRLLLTRDIDAITQTLARTPEGETLLQGVEIFIDRFGFLSACGTDFSRVPWCEQPIFIWRAIGRSASTEQAQDLASIRHQRTQTQERARQRLNSLQRFAFERLLRSASLYIDQREKCSVLLSEDSYEIRRIFIALAQHLVHQGVLTHPEELFFLDIGKVHDLVQGKLETELVQSLIIQRQEQLKADAKLELPDIIYGDRVTTYEIQPDQHGNCLVGIGGSSGSAQGYARVVLDPVDAPGILTSDDILVVPFTDMSWTPIFASVGAIVAETGGQLSHSAIVAREYGVPAVVSVKHATQLIAEGQPIKVDGTKGRVYLQ